MYCALYMLFTNTKKRYALHEEAYNGVINIHTKHHRKSSIRYKKNTELI